MINPVLSHIVPYFSMNNDDEYGIIWDNMG